MAIRSFSVREVKGLHLAEAADLPNLVVIAGPNGAGKSSLLAALKQHPELSEPGTRISYVGPHRPWRRMRLFAASLFNLPYKRFSELLSMDAMPTFRHWVPQELQFVQGQQRLADSADEAQALIKSTIARWAFTHMRMLYDREEGRRVDAVPEVFAPLRDLTRNLLPHLTFSHVEVADDQNVTVLFTRSDTSGEVLVDIDDLSSGEKAIVALFLPFLEGQMEALSTSTAEVSAGEPVPTALIDEPDLHLHPLLQVSLVEYLRSLAATGTAQFIIATHSPTIVDALHEDELFMVATPEAAGSLNQFVRIANSYEKLETMRDLAGATHVLTRGRPIVYVEGGSPTSSPDVTDVRLLEVLAPEAANWAVVPARGRTQAIAAAKQLRSETAETLPGNPVFALVDADQRTDTDPPYVVSWPVAMIENLLLDPDAIWAVLEPHREVVGLNGASSVKGELDRAAYELRDDEIRLRVKARVGRIFADVEIRLDRDVEMALAEAQADLARQVGSIGGAEGFSEHLEAATAEVDGAIEAGRTLEVFRGKEILSRFYDRFAKRAIPGYSAFVYQVARAARDTDRLRHLVERAVMQINWYLPPEVLVVLRDVENSSLPEDVKLAASDLIPEVQTAIDQWHDGVRPTGDRAGLRRRLMILSRSIGSAGAGDRQRQLLRALGQLGVGAA